MFLIVCYTRVDGIVKVTAVITVTYNIIYENINRNYPIESSGIRGVMSRENRGYIKIVIISVSSIVNFICKIAVNIL